MATQIVSLTGSQTYTGNPFSDDFIVIDNSVGSNTLNLGQPGLGGGNDQVIFADAGSNTVTLGDGADQIVFGGAGSSNTLTTGDGNSRITVTGGSNTITVGLGSNVIALGTGGLETVHTGAGNNTVSVSADSIDGDTIHGAVTSMDGSTNRLVLTSSGTMNPVSVNGFQSYQLANGGLNDLTLSEANFVNLPMGSITVQGGDSGNTVDAAVLSAAHSVVFHGGAGPDTFTGGAGTDTFTGGAANDTFIFTGSSATLIDPAGQFAGIVDGFQVGDTIDLTTVGFDSNGTATLGAGNVLQVGENGANHTIGFDPSQNFSGEQFSLSSDGKGGTDVALSGFAAPSHSSAALAQLSDGSLDYLEFSGANLIGSEKVSYTSWNTVAEGDFNNDGKPDLVAQDPSSGAIDLLFTNNGDLQGSELLNGGYWHVVGAGDFDGSGKTEIATQSAATGQVNLLSFTGAQLTSSLLLNGAYQPVVGVADLNGDGKADLVTQDPVTGQLDFLIFNGADLAQSMQTSASYWSVHDVINAGGIADTLMVSQNNSSGAVDYLKFSGAQLTGSSLETTELSGLSVVQGTQVASAFFHI